MSVDRDAFARDGYLTFDTGIPGDVLRGAREDPAPFFGLDGRLQDFWKRSPSVQRVATWPRVTEVLRELYGRQPKPFQTLNFCKATEQGAHSDTIHFNSLPPGWMCGVWVALEDIHPDSGPLFVVAGSHTLPELTFRDAGVTEPPWEDHTAYHQRFYGEYEQFIAAQIAARGLARHVLTPRAGEAIVWAANLLHGGSRRADASRSRHSQVTHYYFEGVQPWTPMFSRPAQPWRREPEWIPPVAGDPAASRG